MKCAHEDGKCLYCVKKFLNSCSRSYITKYFRFNGYYFLESVFECGDYYIDILTCTSFNYNHVYFMSGFDTKEIVYSDFKGNHSFLDFIRLRRSSIVR